MNIGKTIKEIRKEKKISQVELSKLTNITQAALSQIESGQRPKNETLEKIAKALNVSVSHIYVMSIEKEDVPANKKLLYDSLFPVIKSLLLRLT